MTIKTGGRDGHPYLAAIRVGPKSRDSLGMEASTLVTLLFLHNYVIQDKKNAYSNEKRNVLSMYELPCHYLFVIKVINNK